MRLEVDSNTPWQPFSCYETELLEEEMESV